MQSCMRFQTEKNISFMQIATSFYIFFFWEIFKKLLIKMYLVHNLSSNKQTMMIIYSVFYTCTYQHWPSLVSIVVVMIQDRAHSLHQNEWNITKGIEKLRWQFNGRKNNANFKRKSHTYKTAMNSFQRLPSLL